MRRRQLTFIVFSINLERCSVDLNDVQTILATCRGPLILAQHLPPTHSIGLSLLCQMCMPRHHRCYTDTRFLDNVASWPHNMWKRHAGPTSLLLRTIRH